MEAVNRAEEAIEIPSNHHQCQQGSRWKQVCCKGSKKPRLGSGPWDVSNMGMVADTSTGRELIATTVRRSSPADQLISKAPNVFKNSWKISKTSGKATAKDGTEAPPLQLAASVSIGWNEQVNEWLSVRIIVANNG